MSRPTLNWSSHTLPLRRCIALLTAALGTVMLIGIAPPAQAVTGGSPDGMAHPYVAGIMLPGQSRIGCSGVLVRPPSGGPSVVLTAAHCLSSYGANGAVRVSFAADATTSGGFVSAWYHIDPDYQPGTSHLHDIAVLRFADRVLTSPANLPSVGLLDRSPSQRFLTVGYGDPHRGQRRSATENLVQVSGAWLFLRQGSGNSCSGDSGGPDLLPGSATVVALTDQGSCSNSQDFRLDTQAVRDFVDRAAGLKLIGVLSRSRISLGDSVVLRATTATSAAGRQALRQGYYSGAWHTWASRTVGRDGTVSFPIRPTVRATDHYRVLLPSTRTAAGGVSLTKDLVVS